jgi:ubiquinone/menaquinone biosynthesis C-methylase UbiE
MTFNQNDGTQRWDNNAGQWHKLFGEKDLNRSELLDSLILQVLGDVKGKAILDAGCGDGYLSRKPAVLGAAVTGVECSPKLVNFAIADERKEPLGITYHHADCTSLPFLAAGIFDIVVTNNVVQDVENYQEAFREFSRLLKSGGTYLHIENHPCFMTPVFGLVKDNQGEKLYRKVDQYFQRGPFLTPWGRNSGMEPTVFRHRTLGDIINSLIACNFRIVQVIEPEPPESWVTNHPEMMDASRIPDFLVLICRKE